MAISFGGFDNPMDSVLKGQKASEDFYNAQRKARAYNALREQYGDIAGDPDSAVKLGNYLAQQQKLPLELEGMDIKNRTARQTFDFNEQNNPMVLDRNAQIVQKGALDLDFQRQNDPVKLEGNRQTVDSQRLKNTAGAHEIMDSNAARQRNAVLGVVAAVRANLEAGMDPQQAFDSAVPQIAAQEGVDPAQLAPIREKFLQNPEAALNAIEAGITGAHPNTALMRAQAAQTSAEAAKLRAANAAAAKGNKSDPVTQLGALEVADARMQGNIETIDQMLGTPEKPGLLFKGTSSSGLFRGIENSLSERGIPIREDNYSLHKAIDEIKHSISITDLQNMRDLGVSLGRVTNVEFLAASSALSSLDPRERPEITAQKLRKVRDFIAKARGAQEARAERLRNEIRKSGGDPNAGRAPTGTAATPSADDFLTKYGIK